MSMTRYHSRIDKQQTFSLKLQNSAAYVDGRDFGIQVVLAINFKIKVFKI